MTASPDEYPTRAAIARAVCAELEWRTPGGELKLMSARVALLRMHRDGRIVLPPVVNNPSVRAKPPRLTAASAPQLPIHGSRGDLSELRLVSVTGNRQQGRLWRELVARYHYLGYQPLPGAQMCYLIESGGLLLGVIGFGAAAWKIAPRDRFIGWTDAQRQAHLHLVVNNARFLLLPWVQVRFLASSVLALAARQIGDDWHTRYGYRPLLLETFVERDRFAGTSYAAANWIRVGQTQGRGKLDRYTRRDKPVKDIWLCPLDRRFREELCAP